MSDQAPPPPAAAVDLATTVDQIRGYGERLGHLVDRLEGEDASTVRYKATLRNGLTSASTIMRQGAVAIGSLVTSMAGTNLSEEVTLLKNENTRLRQQLDRALQNQRQMEPRSGFANTSSPILNIPRRIISEIPGVSRGPIRRTKSMIHNLETEGHELTANHPRVIDDFITFCTGDETRPLKALILEYDEDIQSSGYQALSVGLTTLQQRFGLRVAITVDQFKDRHQSNDFTVDLDEAKGYIKGTEEQLAMLYSERSFLTKESMAILLEAAALGNNVTLALGVAAFGDGQDASKLRLTVGRALATHGDGNVSEINIRSSQPAQPSTAPRSRNTPYKVEVAFPETRADPHLHSDLCRVGVPQRIPGHQLQHNSDLGRALERERTTHASIQASQSQSICHTRCVDGISISQAFEAPEDLSKAGLLTCTRATSCTQGRGRVVGPRCPLPHSHYR